MSQEELFAYVKDAVEQAASGKFTLHIGKGDMFLAYFPMTTDFFPVLASHLDIIHRVPPNRVGIDPANPDFYIGFRGNRRNILGADDRNGVWTMLKLIEAGRTDWGYIFTKEEETGRKGAIALRGQKILSSYQNIAYFIQIDRRDISDLVFYPLEDIEGEPMCHQNTDFIAKLSQLKGYYIEEGSSTDLKEYCAATGICGINISAGYYNEHHDDEYSDIQYVQNLPKTIEKLIGLLGTKQYWIEGFPKI